MLTFLWRSILEVWRVWLRHPARTLMILATFGFGAASVIVTLCTVEGGRRSIVADLEGIGVDVIVALNPVKVGPLTLGAGQQGEVRLDLPRIEELTRRLQAQNLPVEDVIPFAMDLVLLNADRGARTTTCMVTDSRFQKIMQSGLLAGRFLQPGDADSTPVPVVFDENLARKMLPLVNHGEPANGAAAERDKAERDKAKRDEAESADGEIARLVGHTFGFVRNAKHTPVVVVGVMNDPISLRSHFDAFDANKSARAVGARRLEFENVYFPFDREKESPSGTFVRVSDLDRLDQVSAAVGDYLQEINASTFLFVQKQWIDQILSIVNTFTALANFIWIIDLVIVVILVGTLSLLAIEERYHEIAIRRTEGATVSQVVFPLLLEGAGIALLSCPVGWGVAQLILKYQVQPVLLWQPQLPSFALWMLPLALVCTGVASNLLSARRIARLNPAQVLCRYEG